MVRVSGITDAPGYCNGVSTHFWLHLSVTAPNDVGMMVWLKFPESLGAGGGNAQWHCGIFRKPRAGPVFWFAMADGPQGLSRRVIYYSAIISASLHFHVDFQYVRYLLTNTRMIFYGLSENGTYCFVCGCIRWKERHLGSCSFIHSNVSVCNNSEHSYFTYSWLHQNCKTLQCIIPHDVRFGLILISLTKVVNF